MSGTTWVTLAETGADPTLDLPPGMDLPRLHAAVAAEIGQGLGAAHAALFARPVAAGSNIAWQAAGQDVRRLADLPAESRRALLGAAGAILSDIRRLVESGRAPTLQRVWPGLRRIPGLASVFAVDGRPVLAAWSQPGRETADPLAAYDDGVGWTAPPAPSWRPWAAGLGGVAALALLAVLLLPRLAGWAIEQPAMCRIDPPQLALMRQQADAEARGIALGKILAATNDEIGSRELQCPIPVVQAPAPPPRPAAPPPPRAELPSDAWDRHDLAMLEGCWHSSTQMLTREEATGRVLPVVEWRLCFDRNGRGRQTIRWVDQRTCTGPEEASFRPDNSLLLTDTSRCTAPGRTLVRGRFECRRVSDSEATCTRTDAEGAGAGQSQTGRFTR